MDKLTKYQQIIQQQGKFKIPNIPEFSEVGDLSPW